MPSLARPYGTIEIFLKEDDAEAWLIQGVTSSQ
jgi:hypothetical protein